MPDPTRCQKGVTLLELLIAVTILAIGLLSIAEMQITSLQTNSKAATLSVATSLAEGVLEQFMARDSTDSVFATTVSGVLGPDQTISGAGTYHETYSVDPNTPVNGVAQITVKVTETTGSQRSVTLIGFKKD